MDIHGIRLGPEECNAMLDGLADTGCPHLSDIISLLRTFNSCVEGKMTIVISAYDSEEE